MPKLKTIKEVAGIYEVSITTVHNWIKDGLKTKTEKVIGIRPRQVIDLDELDKFLNIGVRDND
jgi:transposase